MSPDIPVSIKARLLNKVRQSGGEFELFLVRYACERFLYRLGASGARNRCILKGAALLSVWMRDPYRSTRDIDLLAFGPNTEAGIRAVIEEICATPCPEDGLRFDLGSLEVNPIRAEDEYVGQRATLWAYLGKARIRMQVDFGFGDAITPGPEDVEYPTLITDLPHPHLRAYPKAVTIAEKLEAMVQHGRRNSRMKDFHDVWTLSSTFAFSGMTLQSAIAACFSRRCTKVTSEVPDALSSSFYIDVDPQSRWSAYLRGGAFKDPPPERFAVVGNRVIGFLEPIHRSIADAKPFTANWPPGGPWG